MSSIKRWAAATLAAAVLSWATAPALAHCGKCAGDAKEIAKSLDAGKVTLAKVIEAAEAACKGKAVAVNSAMASGKPDIDVTCVAGDKTMNVEVDATGKAGKTEEAKGATGGGDVVKAMEAGKMTMGKVLEAAEAHSKGKALAVTAKAAAGKASYEVYAMAGDKLQKVTVDDHGHATAMAEAQMLPSAAPAAKPAPKPGG